MRIEVLGTVRGWRDHEEMPLGSPQQRGVLAILAIADGRPVPVSEIVAALWPEQPPASAVNTVQTYVQRLRRALEPARIPRRPSVVLPRRNAGYALRVDPDAVDLWRFRLLVRAAGAADCRDGAHAFRALREALEIWQGAPAADVGCLMWHPMVARVHEEHGAAVGWFADLALRGAGAAAEALPVVAHAAACRPYDEPLHARLIRLYRAAGRRPEGVLAFQQNRQWLRDELGLSPGQELMAAYRELLQDDPP